MRPTNKDHSNGYVKPDGNPMTGGEWRSTTDLYKKFIPIDSLTDDEAVAAWLADKYGEDEVYIEAYITEGEDTSTNYYGYEVYEWFDDKGFEDVLFSCPMLSETQQTAIWEKLEAIAYDTDDYKPCE